MTAGPLGLVLNTALRSGLKYGPQRILAEQTVWHLNYLRFNYIYQIQLSIES